MGDRVERLFRMDARSYALALVAPCRFLGIPEQFRRPILPLAGYRSSFANAVRVHRLVFFADRSEPFEAPESFSLYRFVPGHGVMDKAMSGRYLVFLRTVCFFLSYMGYFLSDRAVVFSHPVLGTALFFLDLEFLFHCFADRDKYGISLEAAVLSRHKKRI